MDEEWRDAVGYWPYQVSNHGRFRVSPGAPAERGGPARPGSLLSLNQITQRGYIRRDVYQEGRRISVKVHRLVARAFLGLCPDGWQVNHKNGIKTDNSVGNLEYVTGAQNARHASTLGLTRGRQLTREGVIDIRGRLAKGERQRLLAQEYNVTAASIQLVHTRKTWKPDKLDG